MYETCKWILIPYGNFFKFQEILVNTFLFNRVQIWNDIQIDSDAWMRNITLFYLIDFESISHSYYHSQSRTRFNLILTTIHLSIWSQSQTRFNLILTAIHLSIWSHSRFNLILIPMHLSRFYLIPELDLISFSFSYSHSHAVQWEWYRNRYMHVFAWWLQKWIGQMWFHAFLFYENDADNRNKWNLVATSQMASHLLAAITRHSSWNEIFNGRIHVFDGVRGIPVIPFLFPPINEIILFILP